MLVMLLGGAGLACERALLGLEIIWPGNGEVVFNVVEVLCVQIAGSQGAVVTAKVFVVITRRVSDIVLETHDQKGSKEWERRCGGTGGMLWLLCARLIVLLRAPESMQASARSESDKDFLLSRLSIM